MSATDLAHLFQQTSKALYFVNTTSIKCYNATFNFDVHNICEYFNCKTIQFQSILTVVDETSRVHLNRPTASVVIELPEKCKCAIATPTTHSVSNDRNDIREAIIVPSLVIAIAVVIMVMFMILCRRKIKMKLHQ